MNHFMKKISLKWRLTLMMAGITAIACITLTFMLGKAANMRMDEVSELWVNGKQVDMANSDMELEIEVVPGYEKMLADSKRSLWRESIFAMAGMILVSGFLTCFMVGKVLRQLNELGEHMEQVQAQNLSVSMEYEDFPKEVKRLSVSFHKMLERLEQSFQAQKQFSANAAHELRTPLAVMKAKIDVFQKTENHSEEEYEQTIHMLNAQIERLSDIVNELLEMTGLEIAEMTDKIFLHELVDEILCDLEYQAQQKNITLIQEPGNVTFIGNETLIYRLVFNLIENAIKYNKEEGVVSVSIEQADRKAALTVSDTGLGIPEEYKEQIFEPFFRVDKSRSREMGGAGIGLAIVKKIANLHGGTVYVKESVPGKTKIVLEVEVAEP